MSPQRVNAMPKQVLDTFPARCSKEPLFSPTQPRRTKMRHSACKAAAPQLTLVSRFTPHGCWKRCENDTGGFFQHHASCFTTNHPVTIDLMLLKNPVRITCNT